MNELQIHVDTEDRSNLTVRGYLDGAEVGYVSLAPMKDSAAMNQDPPVPPNSYMVDISGVATGLQGRGLGTKLYVAAIEEARKRGIDRVYAGITQSTEAQGVWKKLKVLYPTQWDKDWGTYIPLQTGKAVTASDWEPWIGVDLDGTLAKELKEFDPFVIGEPIPAMVEKIKKAIEDGKTVKVLTARMADKEKADKIAKIIAAWTKKHVGTALDATCEKDPGMEEIWDDKARGVVKNKGVFAAATIKNPDVLLGNYPRNVMGYKAFLVLPNGKIIPPHEGASEHAALLRENGFDDPKQNYGSGKTYEQMFGEFFNKGGLRVSVNNNSTAIQFGSRKAIPLILSLLNHIPTIDAVAEDWKNRILAEGTAKEVEGQLRREMSKVALKLNIKKDPNVAATIADLDGKFPVSPINPKERVFYAQGQPAVTIEYTEREGRLRIKSIQSLTQKSGLGSLVLERILKVADQHGVTVELTASPFGEEKGRIGGDKLKEWYTRFGFHPEPGHDEALGYMVREPKTAKMAYGGGVMGGYWYNIASNKLYDVSRDGGVGDHIGFLWSVRGQNGQKIGLSPEDAKVIQNFYYWNGYVRGKSGVEPDFDRLHEAFKHLLEKNIRIIVHGNSFYGFQMIYNDRNFHILRDKVIPTLEKKGHKFYPRTQIIIDSENWTEDSIQTEYQYVVACNSLNELKKFEQGVSDDWWNRGINRNASTLDVPKLVKRLAKYCCREWQCKVEDINRGVCDEFAYMLQNELPGSSVLELSMENDSEWPTHFWVKYQGKHYDATCPEGVSDWKQLPIFRKAIEKGYPPPSDDELIEDTGSKTAAYNSVKNKVWEFWHGTTWERADQIDKEGLKKNKGYVWMTLCPIQAGEYGRTVADFQHEDDSKYAIVHFKWPLDKTEADPEHGDEDYVASDGNTEYASHRRTPYDIPRSAITKIEYFEADAPGSYKNVKLVKTASPMPRKLRENVTFRVEDDGNYYVCVATNEEGKDIGHLDFEVIDGTRPTGFVRSSGLENPYQDKGIGFLMYKEAIDFLHKKGVNYFASDQNQNMSGQAQWLWDSYLSKQYDVTQFNENDNEFRYIIKTAVRNEEAHKAVALRKQMLEYVMNDPELMFEVGEFRRTFNDQHHRKEDSEFSKLVETYGRPEADRAMQQVREDIENILEQYASGRDGIYPPELAEKVLEAVPDDLLFQFTEARRKEKTAAHGEVSALYIEVPKGARDHFWEEPPPHNWEFWAFKSHPYALKGERIIFTFNKKPVAESIVHHVEEPGKSKCENTGKYENHWKVYWQPSDFKRYRTAAVQGEKAWISPDGEYNKLRHVHDTHNDYAINVLGMNAKRAMEKGWVRKVGAGVYHAERLTPAAQLTVEKDIMTDNPSMIHIRLEDRGEASFPFSTFIEKLAKELLCR